MFEVGKFGSIGSVKVDLTNKNIIEYQVNSALRMAYVHYFYADELIPRVRQWQSKDPNIMNKHPFKRLVPLEFNDFDWADHELFSYFFCSNVKVKYFENQFFDPTTYPVEWSLNRDIEFKCITHRWRNRRIRAVFVLPANNHTIKYFNENPEIH